METHIEKFSSNEYTKWRDILLHRKNVLLETEKAIEKHALAELGEENTGEISHARLHSADLATNTQEIETLGILSEKNIKIIQEIEWALGRLENGSFGICESCGEKISKKRLELIPEARFCVSCENERSTSMTAIEQSELKDRINSHGSEGLLDALSHLQVSDIMQTELVTVKADESLDSAVVLLLENEFRHLPVVDSAHNLLGIISDRDLFRVVLRIRPWKLAEHNNNAWGKRQVRDVMTKDPETVTPDTDLVEAGTAMLENKISSLPVVEGNRLVGILTESDYVKFVCQLL